MSEQNRAHLAFEPPSTTLVDVLRYWSNVQPNKVAFYSSDGETESDTAITFAELDHAARAIAVKILENHQPGSRGLLLYQPGAFPPGIEFVRGFFGCLYAGCICVPAYPPRRNRKGARIQGIAEDCQAQFALTNDDTIHQIRNDEATRAETESVALIASDTVDRSLAIQYTDLPIPPSDLAVLQYTSGSTGQPKGVMLSHANLIRNCEMIFELFQTPHSSIGISWLPAYHDMGLIGGILTPMFVGASMVLMTPMSFLQRPVRWLRRSRSTLRLRAVVLTSPISFVSTRSPMRIWKDSI